MSLPSQTVVKSRVSIHVRKSIWLIISRGNVLRMDFSGVQSFDTESK